MQRYHQLSDATMDKLLESLEDLLDDLGKSDYEIEYSVCYVHSLSSALSNKCLERRVDTQAGSKWDLRDKQTTS